jgi:hypothetical protein
MSVTENQVVEVTNNSTGGVSYYSEYSRIERRWERPNVTKKIPLEELKELVSMAGGFQLLENYLLIKDMTVREELGLSVEKSYVLEEKDIKALFKKSVDALVDTLENTSDSIKEKIAQIAIDTKLADLDKLEAIKEHTGIDALVVIQEKKEEEKQEKAAKNKTKDKAK